MDPVWLERRVILAVHERLIAAHGGSKGMRDEKLLDSALARPQHILAYEDSPSLFDLAAAYAFGIVKNHPFMDGNKRSGFMAAYIFLARNGMDPQMAETEVVEMIRGLADGSVDEPALAAWFAATCAKRES